MPNTTGPSKTPGTTKRIKTAKNSKSKAALEKFKYEVASEVGVTLKEGYNGDLTSAQAGSIGGHMVKKICPERIMRFTRDDRRNAGHCRTVTYEVRIEA